MNSDIKSKYISAQADYNPISDPDHNCGILNSLYGYEIKIMAPEEKLSDYDPFLEGYKYPDKVYKQRAWSEIEIIYGCDIQVVPYPEEAPFGNERINWIIENANNSTSKADLCVVPSEWIKQLVNANAAIDVSELYGKYGLS